MTHITALHGITYSNEIDVVADGYQMRLVDLYREPKLFVRFVVICFYSGSKPLSKADDVLTICRYPDNEQEVEYYYPGDDPFYNELTAICSAQDKRQNNITEPNPRDEVGLTCSTPQSNAPVEHASLLSGDILSSFEDATKTYEFSWRIRLESERGNG